MLKIACWRIPAWRHALRWHDSGQSEHVSTSALRRLFL